MSFTGTTPLKYKKEVFLSNVKNKEKFIKILTEKLQHAGCIVMNTAGDANVLIAQIAADMSDNKTVVVIGEETNLLILLCYYAKEDNCGLYLRSGEKSKTTKATRLWNITETQKLLGKNNSKYLFFVHAFGRGIFGVGEGALYTKLKDHCFSGIIKYNIVRNSF